MCSIVPESSFQFTTPVLAYFEFAPNKDFNAPPDQEVQTQIRMGVAVNKNNLSPNATVDLTVEMGEKDGNSPFYIRAVEHADFRWGDNLNDEMVKRLLDQNAPTLLLSYLRSVIVQVTAASTYGVCNIPFVDFTKFTEMR
ncbi:MAG: protein-export chaperone SecB [Synergistaceae bacterium]|nr:protein-export chaperone SecB [Synergistaceae bacterium]